MDAPLTLHELAIRATLSPNFEIYAKVSDMLLA
jgi:hypothetical protein